MHCITSPLGHLQLKADADNCLTEIDFCDNPGCDSAVREGAIAEVECAAEQQLAEYFAGQRREFDLPWTLHGTVFQRAVWQVIATIPWSETLSYGEVARRIGRPKAVRAVGAACGRNPLSIVIPCHRVVGSDGSLTGYGGGLARKVWLLEFERCF